MLIFLRETSPSPGEHPGDGKLQEVGEAIADPSIWFVGQPRQLLRPSHSTPFTNDIMIFRSWFLENLLMCFVLAHVIFESKAVRASVA